MVGGCLLFPSCLPTCIFTLFLMVCFSDAEDFGCQGVIHKNVGESAELSSCLQNETISSAKWKHGPEPIAIKDNNYTAPQYKSRLIFHRNFNIIIQKLTLQDSGDFTFVSRNSEGTTQRPTALVTLHVHEPILKPPVITHNSTWHTLNGSCTILLECSTTANSNVTYSWTVRNRTTIGSRLKYITEQEEDMKVTCTVSNNASEMSTSTVSTCSNTPPSSIKVVMVLSVTAGCTLIVAVAIALVVFCKKTKSSNEAHDLTVYAEIFDVPSRDISSPTKPGTLYDTIENTVNSPAPEAKTIYDKIQFNHVRGTSMTYHQEIPRRIAM